MKPRRWELTETEHAAVASAVQGGPTVWDILSIVRRQPALLPDLARMIIGSAARGVRDDDALVWLVDVERARQAVPDVAHGVQGRGEGVFLDRLARWLGPERSALEIGCGGGRISRHVAPSVRELVCTDISRTVLEEARGNLAEHANVRFGLVSGFDLEGIADDSFDLVFGHDVLLTMDPNPALAILDEARRVLRAGGACVMSFFTIDRSEWARRQLDLVRRGARSGHFGASQPRPYTADYIAALYSVAGLEVVEDGYEDVAEAGEQPHYVVAGQA